MLAYIRKSVQISRKDEGAAAVEYGLLIAAIAAIIILVVFAIGKYVLGAFTTTCNGLSSSAQVGVTAACK